MLCGFSRDFKDVHPKEFVGFTVIVWLIHVQLSEYVDITF